MATLTQLLLHQTVAETITRHPRSLVQHLDMQQPHEVPARKEVFSMMGQGVGATLLPDTMVPATVDSMALVVTTIPPAILDTMPHQTPVAMTWDIICQLLI